MFFPRSPIWNASSRNLTRTLFWRSGMSLVLCNCSGHEPWGQGFCYPLLHSSPFLPVDATRSGVGAKGTRREIDHCFWLRVMRQNLGKSRAQLTLRSQMCVRHRVPDAANEFNSELTPSSLELCTCLRKRYLFAMAVTSKLLECCWKCQPCWWR